MENTLTSESDEVVFNFPPFLRQYKDGRVVRLLGTETVPPSTPDPTTLVSSKDVTIQIGVSARLYLPNITTPRPKKRPLLVYFHGGAFCVESAFSPTYHNYLNPVASEANVVIVSVDYRLAPEYPLPIAYDDSWAVLRWVASHSTGSGSESWLTEFADFDRVFFAGDSAGANIAHNMAMRVKDKTNLPGMNLVGIILTHPFFCGVEPVGAEVDRLAIKGFVDKSWLFIYPASSGSDDPVINPAADPELSGLGCSKVLVCVSEKDMLRERGWFYYETLRKSEWGGNVEFMEFEEEDHVFHLFKPTCEKAVELMKKVVLFINQD